jgi:hypothetical protein
MCFTTWPVGIFLKVMDPLQLNKPKYITFVTSSFQWGAPWKYPIAGSHTYHGGNRLATLVSIAGISLPLQIILNSKGMLTAPARLLVACHSSV